MTVAHGAAARTSIADAVLADIDSGTAGAIKLYLANGTTEVANLPLASPAGTTSGPTLTFDCTPALEDASPTGNASEVTIAKIFDSSTVEVLSCSVAQSGADLNFPGGNTFSSSDTVQVTSLSYTAPT